MAFDLSMQTKRLVLELERFHDEWSCLSGYVLHHGKMAHLRDWMCQFWTWAATVVSKTRLWAGILKRSSTKPISNKTMVKNDI